MVRFPVWVLGFITLSLVTTPPAHCNISCRDAMVTLLPCKPFLTGTATNITAPCCDGAQAVLKSVAASNYSQPTLQELCRCLENVAVSTRINPDKAKQIPRLCRIILPAPIDPSINCATLRALYKHGGGGGDTLKQHKKTGIFVTMKNAKFGIYSHFIAANNKKQHPRRRPKS